LMVVCSMFDHEPFIGVFVGAFEAQNIFFAHGLITFTSTTEHLQSCLSSYSLPISSSLQFFSFRIHLKPTTFPNPLQSFATIIRQLPTLW
jgi:hypothetical protein